MFLHSESGEFLATGDRRHLLSRSTECNLRLPTITNVGRRHSRQALLKMSSFAAKRKARVIQTLDDDDDADALLIGDDSKKDGESIAPACAPASVALFADVNKKSKQADAPPIVPVPQGPIKFGRSKPAKSSSLRKSINFNDEDSIHIGDGGALLEKDTTAPSGNGDDGEAGAPVVIRPALSRSSSTKQKKRGSTASRLSFGPSELAADDQEGATVEVVTPKKTLGKRALENNALRKSASLQNLTNLPTRFGAFGSEEERPRYSREYLEELQSSTPNTPQNIRAALEEGEAMDLDPSELDGALVVQSQDLSQSSPSAQALATSRPPAVANVLSETEIRERKERRARLAQEADFILLDGSSDSEEREPNRITLQFKSKKAESRLIAEDEDLGEGYDEFVQDGGLALGHKAEREASRRHRQEMAELIQAAEANSDAESDDSEAERRAAYEMAQRRAGMDGLHRADDDDVDNDEGGASVIPRMKPLPDMDEVLQRMRRLVQGLEDEVTQKRGRMADLEREKEEILAREKEVQEILNQAGAKYQALVGSSATAGAAADISKLASQSPLRPLPPGIVGDLPVERGLESFGTPTKRPEVDEEMD
ncbi:nineteen complex-related protein 2-domain-containing protein [Lasiosphaeria hispida]|uniref:Nineteen complex-related protein 2-domain-containing protein n=1 Tax=Lasiosphaeria hispida TaxID=260671 RepID=A0AAJ0H7F1_9PEZI|nr:nineteen complex-related protein 2-domain-containing protein [Lasiosphaeria hispida]